MKLRIFLALALITVLQSPVISQVIIGDDGIKIDYSNPKEYEIGGITVSGIQFLDQGILVMLSGLDIGQKVKVPGEEITNAIENLWKQGLFEDIKISVTRVQDELVFLDIYLKERPRLSKFSIIGIRKGEADNVREKINLTRGDVITPNTVKRTSALIKKHFVDKGFLNTEVNIKQIRDTSEFNSVILDIAIKKNDRVKVKNINFIGNESISAGKLRRSMKKTKQKRFYNLFKSSKFIQEDFNEDKIKIIDKYNEYGYRDALILSDTVYNFNKKTVNIDIHISEGHKYYFRHITWVGNSIHSTEKLNKILNIKKGDVYNQKVLDSKLYMSLDGMDVSSLYLDDGYLFFNITPVEVNVENDSIDLEIRIYEGKQARVRKVSVTGNTRTNDNVIIREIRTKPGELFSRADIIRTTRELAQLRYFDAEKIGVNPKPNPIDGTVDIEYVVEETSSDQVELSGGWGMGRVVGTLGLSFNNYSLKKTFKKGAWRPLPSGDGQKLALRAQSNGIYYQAYNLSFTEPWLGGRKPNALSFAVYHSLQSNGVAKGKSNREAIAINGISVGIGKRLQWPDDYFTLYQGFTYQNYDLQNYYSAFSFSSGKSNNFSYNWSLSRSSTDQPIFPKFGSEVSLSIQLTPPYSLFNNKDYSQLPDKDKFEWIEYHKWKVGASWFLPLAGKSSRKLVLNTRTKFGFLGLYNADIGVAPFERFYLGGDGLSGYNLDGRELIGLRGYDNLSLTPRGSSGYIGGTIFSKYTLEVRYPLSLNPMATIYVMGFVEAGNAWSKFKQYNPFDVKRSAGVGVRFYLPMFGTLGLDYGYRFDDIPSFPSMQRSQFHFSINNSID